MRSDNIRPRGAIFLSASWLVTKAADDDMVVEFSSGRVFPA